MSYSELMIVKPNGDVEGLLELRNSYGGGICIWRALVEKYRSVMYPDWRPYSFGIPTKYRDFLMEECSDLWKESAQTAFEDAAAGKPIPKLGGILRFWERNVLQWSYDNAMLKRKDFRVMAESMRRFWDALVLPGRVCHLLAIADALEERATDDGVLAACMMQTSLSENSWSVPEGDDEYRAYNINKDTKHWFIDCYPLVAQSAKAVAPSNA